MPVSNESLLLKLDEIKAAFLVNGLDLAEVVDEIEDHFRRLNRALRDLSLQFTSEGDQEPPVVDTQVATRQETPGETAVRVAIAEWEQDIKEPRGGNRNGTDRILHYISKGLGWPAPQDYKDGSFLWCGAFAANCWAHAGMKPRVRKYWMPSCSRMYYGHWDHGHLPREKNKNRVVYERGKTGKPQDIQPGDIVMVGYLDGKASGSHITLCRKSTTDGVSLPTIEGNAKGRLGSGANGEGVVKQTRYFGPSEEQGSYVIMWAWRPLPEDLVEN